MSPSVCLVACQTKKGSHNKSRNTWQLSSPFPYTLLYSGAQNKEMNVFFTPEGMYCFEIPLILMRVCLSKALVNRVVLDYE